MRSIAIARARVVRAIILWSVAAGVVETDVESLRDTTLDGCVGTKLPTAGERIADSIADAHKFASAYWQIKNRSEDPPIAHVEG